MSDATLQIVLALITLMGAIITYLIAPLLKSKLTKEQRDTVLFWTEIAVVAIEKHYEGEIGKGELKKEYVIEFLKNTLEIDKYMSEEQLGVIIDTVVEEVINQPSILSVRQW